MPVLHFSGSTPVPSPDFDDWVRLHEHDGFFVSVDSQGTATLHRASCALVGAAAKNRSTAGHVCSCDRSELSDWARAERFELKRCECV
jgi:hypothetical protein